MDRGFRCVSHLRGRGFLQGGNPLSPRRIRPFTYRCLFWPFIKKYFWRSRSNGKFQLIWARRPTFSIFGCFSVHAPGTSATGTTLPLSTTSFSAPPDTAINVEQLLMQQQQLLNHTKEVLDLMKTTRCDNSP